MGTAIESDVLVCMQRVEASCGYLILNTAGLESGKCWDLNDVCMGCEVCMCFCVCVHQCAFVCPGIFLCNYKMFPPCGGMFNAPCAAPPCNTFSHMVHVHVL